MMNLTAEPIKADQPRVKSPKELAALRAFQVAQTPGQQIQAIENVLANFADTEFKVVLLQTAMQLTQRKNDLAQVLFYGERPLDADPKGAFAPYEAMGQAAGLRKKYDEAVADYKQAISIAATPDAVTWIRLG